MDTIEKTDAVAGATGIYRIWPGNGTPPGSEGRPSLLGRCCRSDECRQTTSAKALTVFYKQRGGRRQRTCLNRGRSLQISRAVPARL